METLLTEQDNLNRIGLDIDKSEELASHLNNLLADYSIFYQNSRGYHWNIQGDKFFELHEKFEELYNDLFEKIGSTGVLPCSAATCQRWHPIERQV